MTGIISAVKVLIWGTGKASVDYMEKLHPKIQDFVSISAFVDSNKKTDWFYGYPVINPEQITKIEPVKLIIMTRMYQNEIISQIKKNNIKATNEVFSIDRFYSEILHILRITKKRICFWGDRDTYQRAKYRASMFLYSIVYVAPEEILDNTYDEYFICPPVYERRESAKDQYVKDFYNHAKAMGVKKERVWHSDAWMKLLFSDVSMCFGELNPEKIIYIISTNEPLVGWANLLMLALSRIRYARQQGMTPVIDMKYADNQYLDNNTIGKNNAWDNYFLPISNIDLESAYKSRNVIICGGYPLSGIDVDLDDIELKSYMKSSIDKWKKENFPKGKILGVIYRGTDFFNGVPGHPMPYELENFISIVKKQMEDIQYRFIFLATEVVEVVIAFERHFKGHVIYTDQLRHTSKERRWLAKVKFNRENDSYLRGMEYLKVLYLLAECNSIISQRNGAFLVAKILNQGRYEYVIEL